MTRWRAIAETTEREQADADPPRRRRAVAVAAGEARADAMSASPASTGASTFGSSAGIVLAVAVAADGELVAVLPGVAEAGLHGAADAEVERQPEHVRAVLARRPRPCGRSSRRR